MPALIAPKNCSWYLISRLAVPPTNKKRKTSSRKTNDDDDEYGVQIDEPPPKAKKSRKSTQRDKPPPKRKAKKVVATPIDAAPELLDNDDPDGEDPIGLSPSTSAPPRTTKAPKRRLEVTMYKSKDTIDSSDEQITGLDVASSQIILLLILPLVTHI